MSDVLKISELVTPQSVHYGLDAGSRKRLFQTMAEAFVDPTAPDREEAIDEIYDGLVERERLGSTALGDGVAIPHCRVNCPPFLEGSLLVFAALDQLAVHLCGCNTMLSCLRVTREQDQHDTECFCHVKDVN